MLMFLIYPFFTLYKCVINYNFLLHKNEVKYKLFSFAFFHSHYLSPKLMSKTSKHQYKLKPESRSLWSNRTYWIGSGNTATKELGAQRRLPSGNRRETSHESHSAHFLSHYGLFACFMMWNVRCFYYFCMCD